MRYGFDRYTSHHINFQLFVSASSEEKGLETLHGIKGGKLYKDMSYMRVLLIVTVHGLRPNLALL